MGINLLVYDEVSGREYPGWDSLRYSGDGDIAKLLSDLPSVSRNGLRDHLTLPPDCEPHYRPTDFEAWRRAASNRIWPNPGRFEALIDILEKNPNCWLYISY